MDIVDSMCGGRIWNENMCVFFLAAAKRRSVPWQMVFSIKYERKTGKQKRICCDCCEWFDVYPNFTICVRKWKKKLWRRLNRKYFMFFLSLSISLCVSCSNENIYYIKFHVIPFKNSSVTITASNQNKQNRNEHILRRKIQINGFYVLARLFWFNILREQDTINSNIRFGLPVLVLKGKKNEENLTLVFGACWLVFVINKKENFKFDEDKGSLMQTCYAVFLITVGKAFWINSRFSSSHKYKQINVFVVHFFLFFLKVWKNKVSAYLPTFYIPHLLRLTDDDDKLKWNSFYTDELDISQ